MFESENYGTQESSACQPQKAGPKLDEVRTTMAAPLVGKRVTVNGIAGRAELNGRTGVAESFNDANGAFSVLISVINSHQYDRACLLLLDFVGGAADGSIPRQEPQKLTLSQTQQHFLIFASKSITLTCVLLCRQFESPF